MWVMILCMKDNKYQTKSIILIKSNSNKVDFYHKYKTKWIKLKMYSTKSYFSSIFSIKKSGYKFYKVNLVCKKHKM